MALGQGLVPVGGERVLRPGEVGQTATELLVFVSIIGVVLTALLSAFVSASKAEADLQKRVHAQQEARLALDQLRRESRCAHAVTPANPTTHVNFAYEAHCRAGAAAGYGVTWCTSGSGTRWVLRRIEPAQAVGSACAGGRPVADYLTQPTVFCFQPETNERRAILGVSFRVGVGLSGAERLYRLEGDVVLRNTDRVAAASVSNCPVP